MDPSVSCLLTARLGRCDGNLLNSSPWRFIGRSALAQSAEGITRTSDYGEAQVIDAAVVGTDLPQLSDLKLAFHSFRQPPGTKTRIYTNQRPRMHSLAMATGDNTYTAGMRRRVIGAKTFLDCSYRHYPDMARRQGWYNLPDRIVVPSSVILTSKLLLHEGYLRATR